MGATPPEYRHPSAGGGLRRAEINDYKSNRPRGNESDDAFAARMRQTYAAQMETYRRALARLTGIPLDDIRATLLLTATRQECPCPPSMA
jgi:hypothetical protein